MSVRLAIHPVSSSFSDRWLEYCRQQGIDHYTVNCFDCDIVEHLRSADALMWHITHGVSRDVILGAHLVRALEAMGLVVFPSSATFWHYDDKLAQKYLLEAVEAPLVPTYIFYGLQEAIDWIDQASFPKVFKLRRGAGSQNVRLVRTADEARGLVKRCFGQGFKPVASILADGPVKLKKHRQRGDVAATLKRLPATLKNIYNANRMLPREKGYALFQEFLPGNTYDTRITVIGDRAFGFTRNVRKNDFRASGSGSIDYDLKRVGLDCVETAFAVARRIGAQSICFDFVRDADGRPKIVEISYMYLAGPVHQCVGHWDSCVKWHEGHIWPQDAILEDLLAASRARKSVSGHSVCPIVSEPLCQGVAPSQG